MNGILAIDKPAGWTSHDVIAKLRGALKTKRIGHGGTLDPMATGVLPVFVGRATRAAEFCENAEKEYIAELQLGITTDTQDMTGNVLSESEVSVTLDDVEAILPQFRGALKQIPPMYSAVKKDGRKLYELARKGIDIPREPRAIFISELELLSGVPEKWSGGREFLGSYATQRGCDQLFTLRIVCSKGTYIRTLCHDIGTTLGCGGTLSVLRRIKAGVFTIDKAHALDDVLAMHLSDSVNDILLPTDHIFSDFPSVRIDETEVRKAKNGAMCFARESIEDGTYRVYSNNGEFLLLGISENNKIKTIKSFFEVGNQ